MKKIKNRFHNKVAYPLILLAILFAGNKGVSQQQIDSFVLTNTACGVYPEKGSLLESRSTLSAGNGCFTTIARGKGVVFFKGHDKIILGPGFHTEPGAKFVAFIETDSAIQSLIQEQLIKNIGILNNNSIAKKFPLTKTFISQNSPNPFSNNTVISYGIAQKFSSAQIMIYDASGRRLKQINVSSMQDAGTVNFNAAAFTPGIYSYSMWIDGQLKETKKMIIIK
ncbi:MAG: T9SS type A sorting domain-containing protein [Agriterribacter sp.]